jgi:hypothetical protein
VIIDAAGLTGVLARIPEAASCELTNWPVGA